METQIKVDYHLGGGWGDRIQWTNPEQFDKEYDKDTVFDCVGWKHTKPKVGQTLKAEMQRSFIIFEFTEVNPCGDPQDMFFAKVKPVEQIKK